jgi:broad specificity phosphatase PhoE
MNLFLVRHGQSRGNVDKSEYFKNPDSEIELTDKGKSDAIDAAVKISNIYNTINSLNEYPKTDILRFSLIHSTYRRATQTANILHDTLNNTKGFSVERKICSPLCIEREWGSLRDIVTSMGKTEEHFNFYYRPVGGESFCDTYKRAALFHQWMLSTYKHDNVIIVAHGEFNKVYLMHLLNWDVEEFDKWAHQKNGEVWFIKDYELSSMTPLRLNKYKK